MLSVLQFLLCAFMYLSFSWNILFEIEKQKPIVGKSYGNIFLGILVHLNNSESNILSRILKVYEYYKRHFRHIGRNSFSRKREMLNPK